VNQNFNSVKGKALLDHCEYGGLCIFHLCQLLNAQQQQKQHQKSSRSSSTPDRLLCIVEVSSHCALYIVLNTPHILPMDDLQQALLRQTQQQLLLECSSTGTPDGLRNKQQPVAHQQRCSVADCGKKCTRQLSFCGKGWPTESRAPLGCRTLVVLTVIHWAGLAWGLCQAEDLMGRRRQVGC